MLLRIGNHLPGMHLWKWSKTDWLGSSHQRKRYIKH